MNKRNSDLVSVTDGIFIIRDATNVGIITEKNEARTDVYLVDSGYSPDMGQTILALLNRRFPPDKDGKPAYKLRAILCTHSHADHVNGNAYLADKTGCDIWITKGEQANLESPYIEQTVICGGYPFPELKIPFYQARPSTATRQIFPDEKDILPGGTRLEFISMPGHHFEMTAILVTTTAGKKVLFTGDAIFGRERMKKYWIPFMLDPGSFKDSLKHLTEISADFFIPSHGDIITDISDLAELNRIAVLSTEKCILSALEKPLTTEEVLKNVADKNHITLGLPQFVLIGCTIRSYLSYLYRSGRIRYTIKENVMYWQKTAL